jgi:hypothetical protein
MELVLIGLVGLLLYNTYSLSEKLGYDFKNLRFSRSRSTAVNSSLTIDMILTNPTAGSVTIQKITGVASTVRSGAIGSYTTAASFTIPPRQSVTVPLNIIIDNAAVIFAINESVKTKTLPAVKFAGDLFTTLGAIPYSYTVERWT